ncbi:MAG: nicotinamide-nucleotide amidase [Halobacteriales archaeon]
MDRLDTFLLAFHVIVAVTDHTDLARRLGEELRDRGETIAVAESCTGGLVGAAITAVPGASDYFDRGFVTYAYGAKQAELGVSREALDEHGAVSAPVAREMARGARDVAGTTWAVATTGVAGPAGGSEETPVGTVYVAVAYAAPWGTERSSVTAERNEFDGDRTAVRERTVDLALRVVLEEMGATDVPESGGA